MSGNFEILNMTKGTLARVPFEKMKNEILGENYTLSLVFCGNRKSKELNKKFRNKDYPTNVLSFELDKENGEIFIAPAVVKKETEKFGKSYKNLIGYLFIHGCLHLKGMEHGSTMDKAEEKLLHKFGI